METAPTPAHAGPTAATTVPDGLGPTAVLVTGCGGSQESGHLRIISHTLQSLSSENTARGEYETSFLDYPRSQKHG